MKKKGLIISTAVMVVVLIAALTTGTFAWFSQTSKTSIDPVTMSVEAASDVRIGMAKTNAYKSGALVSDFVSGTLTWNSSAEDGNKWSGTAALGNTLTTGLTLNMTKAVFTGEGTSIDSTWDSTHGLLEAVAGETGDTSYKDATDAVENKGTSNNDASVLHLVIGVQAAKKDLATITCEIKINTATNPLPNYGMLAALEYCYKVNGQALGSDEGNDNKAFFSTYTANDLTAENAVKDNDGIVKIEIANVPTGIQTGDIYQLDLYIFINGKDANCVTSATGCGCTFEISFSATAKAGE